MHREIQKLGKGPAAGLRRFFLRVSPARFEDALLDAMQAYLELKWQPQDDEDPGRWLREAVHQIVALSENVVKEAWGLELSIELFSPASDDEQLVLRAVGKHAHGRLDDYFLECGHDCLKRQGNSLASEVWRRAANGEEPAPIFLHDDEEIEAARKRNSWGDFSRVAPHCAVGFPVVLARKVHGVLSMSYIHEHVFRGAEEPVAKLMRWVSAAVIDAEETAGHLQHLKAGDG